MTKETLDGLLEYAGLHAPEGTAAEVASFTAGGDTLVSREWMERVLAVGELSEEKSSRLWTALRVIEEDARMVNLSQALAWAYVRLLHFGKAWDFRLPRPRCLTGFARDAYAFLFLLACTEAGRRFLRERGVPSSYDEDIPERMIRVQLRKYREKGEIVPDDYHWDINFYCCAIFQMDRFYFIPCKHWGPSLWRNGENVIALWPEGQRVRQDGQLDGVNGQYDPEAVETTWCEDDISVTAHPVNPRGCIELRPVTLDKRHWRNVLTDGDGLLAMHIPGGEGYTPEAVRRSARLAVDFYEQYYPELTVKGLWSESWLFDPGLEKLLDPDSRILRVQRQFYCYPTMEGDAMAKKEVFGEGAQDLAHFQPRTRLQRAMREAMLSGVRFHTTGMVLLREELEKIGSAPYRSLWMK